MQHMFGPPEPMVSSNQLDYQAPKLVYKKVNVPSKNASNVGFDGQGGGFTTSYRAEYHGKHELVKDNSAKERKAAPSQVYFGNEKAELQTTSHRVFVEPNKKELDAAFRGGKPASKSSGYNIVTGGAELGYNVFENYRPDVSMAKNTRRFQPPRVPDNATLDHITGQLKPKLVAKPIVDVAKESQRRPPLGTLIAVRPPTSE